MPGSFYFQVTLEPHLKHSGARTGRKILFLVEIPHEAVRSPGQEAPDELRLQDEAGRLATELAPLAMSGKPASAGEDHMTVSCTPSSPSADLLERLPDVEKDGARAWLLGSEPVQPTPD